MNPKIDAYINGLTQDWQQKLVVKLRAAIHQADPGVEELIKWGTPAFYHGGPVCWLFCAADWVHFAFIQGALLDNSHGLFVEGPDTANKSKRTMKFTRGDKVPTGLIVKLVKQAIANNKAGKKIKFSKASKVKIILPDDIAMELKTHGLEDEYWSRPYYQQKGYIQWINGAKQAATRTKRITMMIKELETGAYMPPKRERP